MKFKVSRRTARFGKINARTENHGKEDIVPATDIPVKFRGTKRDIDMLCPLMEGKFSELLYSEEGYMIASYLSPLNVHRKPDTLKISIYDQATNSRKPMLFKDAKVKDIQITFDQKHNIEVKLKIQVLVDPDSQGARLYKLMNSQCEFEIEATEMDLFEDEETGSVGSLVAAPESEEEEAAEETADQEQLFEKETGFQPDDDDDDDNDDEGDDE